MSEKQSTASADENDLDMPDELTTLKERAKTLGLRHSPNIGVESLREKIADHLASGTPAAEAKDAKDSDDGNKKAMSENARKAAKRKEIRDEALKLVRLRIANMNPAKKDLAGEIFTVANKYVGIVKKFVPFGEATENGYHVPQIIYEQLKDRKFLQIKTAKGRSNPGNIQVMQRWVPEFSLEVLDPLTPKELEKLAQQQLAAGGVE